MGRNFTRLGVAATLTTLCALVASFSACKNTSQVSGEKGAGTPPPVIHATLANSAAGIDPVNADPLTDPLWRSAHWTPLTGPLNERQTTPPTRAAVLYDANTLYVAFICSEDGAARPDGQVSVWLDTSSAQNGTEYFQIGTNAQGRLTASTWHRAALPPTPREDGTPNFAHPISHLEYPVPGLRVKAGQGTFEHQPAWTVVVAVSTKSLPRPLQSAPKAGTRWRMNLLRNEPVENGGDKRETLQANLSPVYPGAQAVSPYRMADLVLMPGTGGVAAAGRAAGDAE